MTENAPQTTRHGFAPGPEALLTAAHQLRMEGDDATMTPDEAEARYMAITSLTAQALEMQAAIDKIMRRANG